MNVTEIIDDNNNMSICNCTDENLEISPLL